MTTEQTCPRCKRTGGARGDGYHGPCYLMDENDRLRKAVALLNSMVLSGEDHSDTSRAVVREALGNPAPQSGAMSHGNAITELRDFTATVGVGTPINRQTIRQAVDDYDRLRAALQQIMTMGHRLDCLSRSPIGSGCTCPAGVADLALAGPDQGAMSDG